MTTSMTGLTVSTSKGPPQGRSVGYRDEANLPPRWRKARAGGSDPDRRGGGRRYDRCGGCPSEKGQEDA
jgi:hypothetical protein